MNRNVYRLFKPLLDKLQLKGYKEPIIRCEKYVQCNGIEEFLLNIYFEHYYLEDLQNAPCPEKFEIFANVNVNYNDFEPTYTIKMSKVYPSGDVLESEISNDIEVLINWADKLTVPNI
ncbi:hypothetical protein [Vallitalea guaymasensis]|uniref:hypothetical protein n=1 Tax=Vallitalea guaymasensis TaxID=1185412 RepID=UPI000DE3C4ED|nr:hypothetical protein [Vallitalea guaymasensis]